MPITSPGNDDDTGENHQPTLRKNTAEPVEQTLKQNSRRGTRTDPLYRGRRILLKTASLRTDRQKKRADELLGDPSNKPLALAHGVYQKIIACYAQEDRGKGRGMMAELIESLTVRGSAPGCPGLVTLGRTLKRRMADILAFFDHPNGANRPTEAINGRLETLRGHSPRLPQPRQLHH
jgi:transposase